MMIRFVAVSLSLGMICLIVCMALFPTLFTSQFPSTIDLANEFAPISKTHPLGQGENGVDLWAQIVYGARLSIVVALSSVFISTLIGILVGGLGGFVGGWVDQCVIAVIDVMLAFPGMLLAIALASVLGPSTWNVVLLLSITGWPSVARLVRGEILRLKNLDFVQAVHAVGVPSLRIFFRHLLPNVFPVLCVQASFAMAGVIIVESSLSFLGLGVPPGTPSWGATLASGKNALVSGWHVTAVPGLAIMLLVLSFNLVGDWLRDRNDPRLIN